MRKPSYIYFLDFIIAKIKDESGNSHYIAQSAKLVYKEWKAINAPSKTGAGVFIFCIPLSPICQKLFGYKNYHWKTHTFL